MNSRKFYVLLPAKDASDIDSVTDVVGSTIIVFEQMECVVSTHTYQRECYT